MWQNDIDNHPAATQDQLHLSQDTSLLRVHIYAHIYEYHLHFREEPQRAHEHHQSCLANHRLSLRSCGIPSRAHLGVKAEPAHIWVTRLSLKLACVDRPCIHPGWRPSLQAVGGEAQIQKRLCEAGGGSLACPAVPDATDYWRSTGVLNGDNLSLGNSFSVQAAELSPAYLHYLNKDFLRMHGRFPAKCGRH